MSLLSASAVRLPPLDPARGAPRQVFDSYIPGPHVVKFPDAKAKKVGTKITKAPEKGDAAKKVKATAALVKPTHTVFLNLSEVG